MEYATDKGAKTELLVAIRVVKLVVKKPKPKTEHYFCYREVEILSFHGKGGSFFVSNLRPMALGD